jgi:hypothetical protein
MSTRALIASLLLFACLAAAVHAYAEESAIDRATASVDGKDSLVASVPPSNVDANTAMPEAPSRVVLDDPSTHEKYLASMRRYYEYRTEGYDYRSRVFEWQLLSSRVIFAAVLLLVASGIYFAAVQFRIAMEMLRRAGASGAPTDSAEKLLHSEIDASGKGIAVNSSVLGVTILALSLAFFYLYLVYVYPIQNVF